MFADDVTITTVVIALRPLGGSFSQMRLHSEFPHFSGTFSLFFGILANTNCNTVIYVATSNHLCSSKSVAVLNYSYSFNCPDSNWWKAE